MMWIIDRFEGDLAVIEAAESGESIIYPISDLPEGAREGTVLTKKNGRFVQDLEGQKARVNRITEKMERLKKLKKN